jgi:hypothetical protein
MTSCLGSKETAAISLTMQSADSEMLNTAWLHACVSSIITGPHVNVNWSGEHKRSAGVKVDIFKGDVFNRFASEGVDTNGPVAAGNRAVTKMDASNILVGFIGANLKTNAVALDAAIVYEDVLAAAAIRQGFDADAVISGGNVAVFNPDTTTATDVNAIRIGRNAWVADANTSNPHLVGFVEVERPETDVGQGNLLNAHIATSVNFYHRSHAFGIWVTQWPGAIRFGWRIPAGSISV